MYNTDNIVKIKEEKTFISFFSMTHILYIYVCMYVIEKNKMRMFDLIIQHFQKCFADLRGAKKLCFAALENDLRNSCYHIL